LTYDFEWAELPDDIADRKHQAWQQWETIDHQLHDPTHPLPPEKVDQLERQQRAAWKQYWHADGARYHLSNRQMSDAITVMEQAGMARQVPAPPSPNQASTVPAATSTTPTSMPSTAATPSSPAPN
jgi:hypothetical protein